MSKLKTDKEKVVLEKCYVPEKDEKLKQLGIEVCARTVREKDRIVNRIIFKRGNKTADIECIHAAVCDIQKDPETSSGWKTVSTENRPELKELLSVEDQHFALKSFTQFLMENGIQNTLSTALLKKEETGEDPLDFNELMRSQLTNALIAIAPDETKELALLALDHIVAGDPERLELFSKDFEELICHHFNREDVIKLHRINGGVGALPNELKQCVLEVKDLPDEVLDALDPDIKKIETILKAGKPVYFYSETPFRYEEISPEGYTYPQIMKLKQFYSKWEETDDAIWKEAVTQVDNWLLAVSQTPTQFMQKEELTKWYKEEFSDQPNKPNFENALKILEEEHDVGYDPTDNEFFDFTNWYEQQVRVTLNQIKNLSVSERERS